MPEEKKKQLNFLIIDNDAAWRDLLGGLVSRRGGRVTQAAGGAEGITLASKNRPDFIILAVELPDENGYVICKKIKSNQDLNEIPLMLISKEGNEADFERHQKLKVRADSYLKKPFTDEEFITRVHNLIGFTAFGEVEDDQYGKLEMQMHAFLQEQQALERRLAEKDEETKILEEKLGQTAGQFLELNKAQKKIGELEKKLKDGVVSEEKIRRLRKLLEEALETLKEEK
ncbi:MAG: response regulator [Proteobacteria bacterium]|nr:response regulator [Pseudomonadota bacterium]